MPWCPYHPDGCNKCALGKNVQDTCCIDIKTRTKRKKGRNNDCGERPVSETFVAEKNITWLYSTRVKPTEICNCLNSIQYLQLARDCFKENRQRADNQCP